ncbi:MAG: universal stress protein [Chloroflexi bacterium]|nr:universal stress protein [Chloroflexota bacterium]
MMRILIASDGSDQASDAAHFATLIAQPAAAEIILLGVQTGRRDSDFERRLDALAQEIGALELRIREGNPVQQITAEVDAARNLGLPYHLVVVGARGRRRIIGPFRLGSTSLKLSRQLETSLLIVPKARPQLKTILVCTGAGEPGLSNGWAGATLAALMGGRVRVLHVMSQIPLVLHAKYGDLTADAQNLIDSGSREGNHLLRILAIMAQLNIPPERVEPLIRNGLVIDEILREARRDDYDLVVLGAHPQVPDAKSNPGLRALLQENIAAQVIVRARRPVLVIWSVDQSWSESILRRAM